MLILASVSPRRAEILTMLDIAFKTAPAGAGERIPAGTRPENAVTLLAERKALTAQKRYPEDVILAADTVVFLSGLILNKPRSEQDAAAMLRKLSGRTHAVYTGVCILQAAKKQLFFEKTLVRFHDLSDTEIDAYVQTGEPMDKAGAYGIQGRGAVLVREIRGDFYNVMGLPAARLYRELHSFMPVF